MSEAKHTPGPWTLASTFPDIDGYKVKGGSLAFSNVQRVIAVVKNQGSRPVVEDSLSDARLIAAAPDLLAAAKKALDEMCRTIAPRNSFTDAVDLLDAAITKAEGR